MARNKTPVIGVCSLPVVRPDTNNGNPWERNYFAPPQHLDLVSREYELTDIRPLLDHEDYTPENMLQSHGFGIAKHRSHFLEQMQNEEIPNQALTEVYHPEIEELVKKVTGCKKLFILASGLRQGKRVPTKYRTQQQNDEPSKHKLAGQSKLLLAAPVRKPHIDFTPLGARQEIRSKSIEIYQAAKEAGIIDFEDAICAKHSILAPTHEANSIISDNYNASGKLGPRYAAYSIWRPLRKVERDPLTLSPRRETRSAEGEGVYWPYENRIPGPAELNGDYLKEYAALGVRSEKAAEGGENPMKWYYISGHEPDEVLFIKLFDSAALGQDSQHMSAPWHASPEIGSVAGDEPRESIDVRVLVFW